MVSALSNPVLVIENAQDDPVARLGDWLRDAGAELTIVRVWAGEALPLSAVGFSAVVALGGGVSANDDLEWLAGVRSLLTDAVRSEIPVLGVCLGAQLLAQAAGGRVAPAETPEYGAQLVAKRQAAATDPLFRELPITPDVIQWHVDEVTQLPAGATLLASSPVCEVQAFRVGRLAWGVQFHIETTPDIVRRWAADDAHLMQDYDLDAVLDRAVRAHEDVAEVWRPIAERLVEIAADPAAAAGPRTLPMAGSPSAPTTTAGPITDPAAIRAALAAEMQASRGPHGH